MSENTPNHPENQQTRLIPLTKWEKYHPWPSISGLRHLRFYEKEKGCERVFKKCGKKVLVDERAFFEYIEEQNRKAS